ncbi:MAG: response regulator [Chloroflexota bacterium]
MRKTILVIEDEHDIRRDLVRTLELSDYDTLDAADGAAGLELAIKHKPDLIISDIMMPEIDGFQVLKELQSIPDTASIPFLILTAKSGHTDMREGMKLGADDYITKPYDINDLLDAIESRLRKKEKNESAFNIRMEDLRASLQRTLPHEIRTPLNIVLGLSEFLLKNYDSVSQHDALEMLTNINDAGKRLHRLFENYLFYANLEILTSNPEEILDLREKQTPLVEFIVKDLIFTLGGNAGRMADIEIEIEDATLAIYELHFAKIIEEVLENAIKFSTRGQKIFITSRLMPDYYELRIKDYGRGMSKEQIEMIGAYVQFERKIYEQQGTGLGVSIVKKIIDIYGGDIIISSQQNEYTEVTLRFRYSKS